MTGEFQASENLWELCLGVLGYGFWFWVLIVKLGALHRGPRSHTRQVVGVYLPELVFLHLPIVDSRNEASATPLNSAPVKSPCMVSGVCIPS